MRNLNPGKSRVAARSTGLLALATVLLALPTHSRDLVTRETGPRQLLITYHCDPANRIAFREHMVKQGAPRFEKWKREGVLQDYKLLFNWFVDADTWDMLAILSFRDYRDIDRWRLIEKSSPGGLSKEALALGLPRITYAMDLFWQAASRTRHRDPAKSVFLVIPYVYYPASSLDEYSKYVDGYVVPQFDQWIRDDILVSYSIYINRFQTSRPWQAVFVLEYKDTESFGMREKEVDKVKAELAQDPSWKALGDRKLQIRSEKETATAEQLTPPQ